VIGQAGKQSFKCIEHDAFGSDSIDRVSQPNKETLEVIFARFLDLAAFDPNVIQRDLLILDQVIVADGTPEAAKRIERVLTTDPGMGIIRHADAGYEDAIDFAKTNNVTIPMKK